jgi:hypothetical protein
MRRKKRRAQAVPSLAARRHTAPNRLERETDAENKEQNTEKHMLGWIIYGG